MNIPGVDDELRASTGILSDMRDPSKTAADQFAEMVNAGQLDAKYLLLSRDPAVAMAQSSMYSALPQPAAAGPVMTPEVRSIAGDLSQTGVALSQDGDQLPPLPQHRGDHTRST